MTKIKACVVALLLAVIPVTSFAAGSAEKGKDIYDKRCWFCHGDQGAGDGPAAAFLNPPPRDFTSGVYKWKTTPFDEMAPTDEDFTKMIKGGNTHNSVTGWTGMNGTAMPGWAVAAYVNSLEAPYKKPGDNTVISALCVGGELPEKPDDAAWDKAAFTSFYLVPQIIAAERHFTPSLDAVSVKALYNDKDIALLLEWDDRTRSLPGDAKAVEIADGDLYEDAAAIQWPAALSENEKPYFDRSPVATAVVTVAMKRPLKTVSPDKDLQFEEGRFIPVSFAAWDGSNQEKGSKHEMTTWYWLVMKPKAGASVYLRPMVVGAVIVGLELLWLRSARKKTDELVLSGEDFYGHF